MDFKLWTHFKAYKRNWSASCAVLVLFAALSCALMPSPDALAGEDGDKTELFIKSLDVHEYERRGSDFTSPRFSPLRLRKPLEKIDPNNDYDWDMLDEVGKKLAGVDRKRALKYIFDAVTKDSKTNTERHLAVLAFLQKSGFHNSYLQPVYRNGLSVFDPLVLLELGENAVRQRCKRGR